MGIPILLYNTRFALHIVYKIIVGGVLSLITNI